VSAQAGRAEPFDQAQDKPRRSIVAACLRAARKQVRQPVIPQDVAVVPEFLDDGRGVHSRLEKIQNSLIVMLG
jgi:hypothetical protein